MRVPSDDEIRDARMEEYDDAHPRAVCENGHEFDPRWVRASRREPSYPRVDCCPECGTDVWEMP